MFSFLLSFISLDFFSMCACFISVYVCISSVAAVMANKDIYIDSQFESAVYSVWVSTISNESESTAVAWWQHWYDVDKQNSMYK